MAYHEAMGGGWRGSLILLAALPLCTASEEAWISLRTPHFELLTDAGDRYGPDLLQHLEKLHSLFMAQAGVAARPAAPVRIFAFRSAAEYIRYRRDETADAYYFGSPGRDFIVMPLTRSADYRTAAHEYAHAAVHAAGLKLPLWLSEGIAEVFSTVTFQGNQATVGAANPGRMQALQHSSWMPLTELMRFTEPPSRERDRAGMFYAESWALTHMLMFSPAYSRQFAELLAEPSRDVPAVFHVAAGTMERELRTWIGKPALPTVRVTPGDADTTRPVAAPLNDFHRRMALAELQLAIGQVETARLSYVDLERDFPANPEIQASLGKIAVSQNRGREALDYFGRALSLGIRNAHVCYEFAIMAQNAGLPESDVVTALERAVALAPGLDDARYMLGLAYMNSGRFDAALRHLQALRLVPRRRAFAYFTALAHIQTELGMLDEARRSAAEARKVARSEEEMERANDLAWMASSKIVVQMTADKQGQLRRVPSKSAVFENWNPFIEPNDEIERDQGVLREIVCSAEGLRLNVDVRDRTVVIGVTHPERVQLRPAEAGPLEFTCGKQDGRRVEVEFARSPDSTGSAGILRGIRFLQ